MTQEIADDVQDIMPDVDFNVFLDQLMYSLYDNVIGSSKKIQFVAPSLTMYMRNDYGSDYQIASHTIPPTEVSEQVQTLMTLGASAANATEGKTNPVAVFLVTMGQKQKSETATETSESEGEAILISGMSVDGRVCQAIYEVKRSKKDNAIFKIDLKVYMPTRQAVTDNSKVINPLLEAFYTGYTEYIKHLKSGVKEAQESRNGDIILPD